MRLGENGAGGYKDGLVSAETQAFSKALRGSDSGCHAAWGVLFARGLQSGGSAVLQRLGGSPRLCFAPQVRSLLRVYAGLFARRLPPNGVEVLSFTAKKQSRRAGDVNPPVRVRARAASAAAGAQKGRYRPIEIDRSPGMIGPRRLNGNLGLQGI